MIAICLGAMLQVGFGILAGPPMMILLGTSTAVPILLSLNTIVSAVATDRHILKTEKETVFTAIIGCLIGVVAGLAVYPLLSEAFVLTPTACLLLIGLLTSLFPLRNAIGTAVSVTISGLSGLATVWAATPGPPIVFGLIAKGRSAMETAKLVQPTALVTSGIAFLLHNLSETQAIPFGPHLWVYVALTLTGSLCGRTVGAYLPQSFVTAAIRVIFLIACCVLFHHAYTMA